MNRLWKVETIVIPIVVSALGTVYRPAKGLEKNLRIAGTTVIVELLQKAALLQGQIQGPRNHGPKPFCF